MACNSVIFSLLTLIRLETIKGQMSQVVGQIAPPPIKICYLVLKKGLCKYNYVKYILSYHSGLSEWALNPMTSVPIKYMQRGDTQTEVEECEDRGRDGNDGKGCQLPPAARTGCSRASAGSPALLHSGHLDSRTVREHISVVLSHPVGGHLFQKS